MILHQQSVRTTEHDLTITGRAEYGEPNSRRGRSYIQTKTAPRRVSAGSGPCWISKRRPSCWRRRWLQVHSCGLSLVIRRFDFAHGLPPNATRPRHGVLTAGHESSPTFIISSARQPNQFPLRFRRRPVGVLSGYSVDWIDWLLSARMGQPGRSGRKAPAYRPSSAYNQPSRDHQPTRS
jgi:hypothetical protein